MRIGYARVSTQGQLGSLDAQEKHLLALRCERVYRDVASGVRQDRPGLTLALEVLRDGDQLVVTRLDRLGRTMLDTLKTVRDLDARGIRVVADDVQLDTGTPGGRLVATVIAALAEWERDMVSTRTHEAIRSAREAGVPLGRPPALTREAQQAALAALRGGMSVVDVAKIHGVSRWTIARLRDANPESAPENSMGNAARSRPSD